MSEHLKRWSDLRKQPSPPDIWIVDGLFRLSRRRMSLISGKATSGKSTLATQLAFAVSKGTEFLGRQTLKSSVIFWQVEDEAQDVRKALDALGSRQSGDGEIYIFDGQPSENTVPMFRRSIMNHPDVKLVIIETLDDLFRTDDSNANTSWRVAFEKFANQTHDLLDKVSIVALTQNRKTESENKSDNVCGGLTIRAKSDVLVSLTVDSKTERRFIQVDVRRGGKAIPETVLEFNSVTGECTLGIKSTDFAVQAAIEKKELEINELDKQICNYYAQHPNTPLSKPIIAAFGKAPKTVFIRVNHLVSIGRLLREGTGRQADPYRFKTVDLNRLM